MPTQSTTRRALGATTPRGVTRTTERRALGAAPRTGEEAILSIKGAKPADAGRPGFTPVRLVMDAVGVPGALIGKSIRDPRNALSYSAIDAFRNRGNDTIGRGLEGRGAFNMLPEGRWRTAARLVADIGLDPTTYLTFGGAAAARTAAKGASAGLVRQVAEGRAVTLRDVARVSGAENTARAAVPRAVSIGLQVPFTRGKRVAIESQTVARDFENMARLLTTEGIRDKSRRAVLGPFQPAAGTDKAVYRVGRDVANFASTQKRDVSKASVDFQKGLDKALKSVGVSKPEGYRAVIFAAEQPAKYGETVPEALQPFVERLRRDLDEYKVAEDIAGIEKGEVPDYVPHRLLDAGERRRFELQFGATASLDSPFFVKERTFPTIEAGEAAGYKFELNPARLLEVRGHASIDAMAKKAFDDEIASTRARVDVPDAPPEEWAGTAGRGGTETETLPVLASARSNWSNYPSKYLSDVQVDTATKEAVLRVHEQITPVMNSDGGLESIIRLRNTVTARWKALALATPGRHFRDLMAEMMSATWAGARNPASYVQAGRIVAGKGKGVRVKVDGEILDGDQVLLLAKALGIVDQGFSSKEVAEGLAETAGSLKKATTKVRQPGTGAYVQAFRVAGDFRENAVRIGTFLERIKAGDSAYEAARVVRTFHLDYGDVGRFVAGARRFWLPFATYSAKSLPLVGRQIARKPGTLANIDKVMGASNEMGGDPDLSLLSTGSRSSFAVPVPKGFEKFLGGEAGQPVLYNPERTFSFGILNTFDPTQVKAQPAGMLSPFVRGALELPTNYRLYYSGQAAKRQRAPFLVQQAARIPGVGRAIDFGPKRYRYGNETVPGYSSQVDYLMRMFPPFGQSSSLIPGEGAPSVVPSLGSYLTGVRLSPYDRARDAHYAQLNKDRR